MVGGTCECTFSTKALIPVSQDLSDKNAKDTYSLIMCS